MSSNMFSSPEKLSSHAASKSGDISQGFINQNKDYIDKKQGEERAAISGLGPNQYFAAGDKMDPTKYKMDQANVASFSAPPPPQGITMPGQSTPPQIPPNVFRPPTQPPQPPPMNFAPGGQRQAASGHAQENVNRPPGSA